MAKSRYELKTRQNEASVADFLSKQEDVQRRQDCKTLLDLLKKVSGEEPKMWGDSMIGFGQYTYKSEKTGNSGQWLLTGFSPRKQNLSIIVMAGLSQYPELLSRLGKYKTGVSCLYVKKLSDIDMDVLKELLTKSLDYMKNHVYKQ